MPKIIIASGPVIIEDDNVLLNKHGDTVFWKFCGGKVENFEHTLIENAEREVMEEMGLKIEVINKKPFLLHTTKETPEAKIDVILIHYLARRLDEISPGKDIREWRWIPIDEIVEMEHTGELAPNIIPTLQHFKII